LASILAGVLRVFGTGEDHDRGEAEAQDDAILSDAIKWRAYQNNHIKTYVLWDIG